MTDSRLCKFAALNAPQKDKEVFTLKTIVGHLGRREEWREGKERRRASVNCETLVLNLITPIVYGRELKWDLQELYMLGSYIMSSM